MHSTPYHLLPRYKASLEVAILRQQLAHSLQVLVCVFTQRETIKRPGRQYPIPLPGSLVFSAASNEYDIFDISTGMVTRLFDTL
jgi:hypothetical protein